MAQHVATSLLAANSQLVGYWLGGSLGLIRYVAGASTFNGVSFDGATATHSGWGSSSRGDKFPQWQAYPSRGVPPSSSPLLTRILGSRPMELMGTLADMSMGWMVDYLSNFPPPASDPA